MSVWIALSEALTEAQEFNREILNNKISIILHYALLVMLGVLIGGGVSP